MVSKHSKMRGGSELRNRLPKAAISILAKKYNKSWTWIYYVVTGKYDGEPGIIEDAIKLATIEDKRRRETIEVIKGLEKTVV